MLEKFSTKKTILMIIVFFALYFAGAFISSLLMDLIFHFVKIETKEITYILRDIADFVIVILLLWVFTTKVFHLSFKDFGITLEFKWWGILIAVLLPAYMIIFYSIYGKFSLSEKSVAKIILYTVASLIAGLKAGFLEEILFRGYIMRLLDNRWNKAVAILVPSFVFSLLHIPGMPNYSFVGILILIVAGTSVGVMFSLLAYKGNSIANDAIVHGLWNCMLISYIFEIGCWENLSHNSIFTISLPTYNICLTGSDFGIEASLVAIIGYAVVSLICLPKKKSLN